MKSNMKFFFMSLAIAMACASTAQRNSDHNGGGFPFTTYVVKSNEDLQSFEKSLPHGTVVVSRHPRFGILEILNEGLDEIELKTALVRKQSLSFFEKSERDDQGNSILPTGQILIKTKTSFHTAALAYCDAAGCKRIQSLKPLNWEILELPQDKTYAIFEEEARLTGLFELIMRDEIVLMEEHISNDPFWTSCWYVSQSTDKDIDADLAWENMPINASSGAVAVIDGHGFDTAHPDLAGNIIDTYNAVNLNSNVTPTNTYEKHGTACAGIPGAVYNNGTGIPGLGANLIKILAIQIGYNAQASGTFYTSATIQANAINYAMGNASTVAISMSFGGTTFQTSFFNAITSARTTGRSGKGIPVFASTGNNGATTWVNYPASYSGVIAVGSTTSLDTRSSFGNYGSGLMLSAPGTAITTTDLTGTSGYSTTDYTNFSGTSAACPVAASVGAMTIIANPNLTEQQVKTILAQTCEKVGGYSYTTNANYTAGSWSTELGYGRVNMNDAVLAAISTSNVAPDISISSYSVNDNTANVGQVITIQATQSINFPSSSAASYQLQFRWSSDQIWSTTDALIGNATSSLGGGIASEIENISYTVPSGTGTRYVLIKCDATNVLNESIENNNIVIIPVSVSTVTTTPDLTISSMSISDLTPNVGQTVLLSCTQNVSGATSTIGVTMEYRYSTDAIWSTDDVIIGNDISNIGTSPSSETESITFVFPSGTGTRYLLAKADSPNLITESNENNNVFALPVVVAAAVTNPDITISSLASNATNVVQGQGVTVSCQQVISNPPTTTSSVSLEYRWSTDLTFSTSDLLIGTATSTLGGSVTSETENITFSIPDGLGVRYLLVKADANNMITETNESNIYSITFQVNATTALPDIFIDELVTSLSSATPGQQITVSCFQNISDPNYSAVNVFMEYRWATGTTFSTSYSIIGLDYSSIGGGDADDDESLTFTVPAGTGTRYVMIKCDSNNGVAESNENNNVYTIPIQVIAAAIQAPSSQNQRQENMAEMQPFSSEQLMEELSTTKNFDFSFYPNPARNFIQLNFEVDPENQTSCVIYDLAGKLVMEYNIPTDSQNQLLDVSSLSAGKYLIGVNDGQSMESKLLIIAE
jgi:hypothetical protein